VKWSGHVDEIRVMLSAGLI